MGMDVNVHILDKDFNIVKKNFKDFLPYAFRFTFYPDNLDSNYTNTLTGVDLYDAGKYEKVMSEVDAGVWTSIVKMQDVLDYLSENDMSSYVDFAQFDGENLVLVIGDQYYNSFHESVDVEKRYGEKDSWFDDIKTALP